MNTVHKCLAYLKQGEIAMHAVGMPKSHAAAFMAIAVQERCVISSRNLGRVCTSLMSEGYDTKGFRIKSKSCDFGPMAGFLCADPRFQKKGAGYVAQQQADIDHAMHGDDWDSTGKWKASTSQICITPERLKLLQNWDDDELKDARIAPVAMKEDVMVGSITSPIKIEYVLRRETRNGDTVWAVYVSDKPIPRQAVVWRAAWDALAAGNGLKPLLGLVNPFPAYERGHYKNCVIGDYDLFGVWPAKAIYQARGEDMRIAGMASNPKAVNKQIIDWEDQRLGNISNRIHTVAQMINSAVYFDNQKGRGRARNVIHHSDEAGRPFISGIDDHVIAFLPPNHIVAIESPRGAPIPDQWKAFFNLCNLLNYQVILNTHWKWQMKAWGLDDLGTTGDEHGRRPDRAAIERMHAGKPAPKLGGQ